jgi:perosamine synthetase
MAVCCRCLRQALKQVSWSHDADRRFAQNLDSKMQLSPQARFRFYGSPQNFRDLLAAVLSGRVQRSDADIAGLERRFAEWIGSSHALAMPQGRVALYAALRSLIRPGRSVILSPYTIYDVVNMVLCAGGWPVFADVELETCNIDPLEVERLIDDETGAVVVTHLHGLVCDLERVAAICRARGVALIEDCAQCLGGRVHGRRAGTFGDVGIFSFSRAKNVNAVYGGMAVTSDPFLRERMAETILGFSFESTGRLVSRAGQCLVGDILTAPPIFQLFTFWLLRQDTTHDLRLADRLVQAENNPILYEELPEHYRRRMTSLQARLVARQLDDVDRHMEIRIGLARRYHDGLSDLPEIGLPPLREDGSHTYLSVPIRVAERAQLVNHMMRHGRDVKIQHYFNLADLPCFSAYARDCPNARTVARQVLLLPAYPGYAPAEVERNVVALRSYFRRRVAVRRPAGTQIA